MAGIGQSLIAPSRMCERTNHAIKHKVGARFQVECASWKRASHRQWGGQQ
jgi:hypothetical protein